MMADDMDLVRDYATLKGTNRCRSLRSELDNRFHIAGQSTTDDANANRAAIVTAVP